MLSFESVLVDIEYDHKKKDIDFFPNNILILTIQCVKSFEKDRWIF